MKKYHIHVSYLLPIASILIIITFTSFSKPSATGLAVYSNSAFDASIALQTHEGELLPEHAEIAVLLDGQGASLTVKEFIEKTGNDFNYTEGKLGVIDYEGKGFTGNYTYRLNLTAIGLNTPLQPGNHSLKMSIVYDDIVLSENSQVLDIN